MASNSHSNIGMVSDDEDHEDRVDLPMAMELDQPSTSPTCDIASNIGTGIGSDSDEDYVDDSDSHPCDISPYLQNSRISTACKGDYKLLSSTSNEETILKRCGISNDQVINLRICEWHQNALGTHFKSWFTSKKVAFGENILLIQNLEMTNQHQGKGKKGPPLPVTTFSMRPKAICFFSTIIT